jgi:phosphoglycolate phosphatase-like HAD superfamily hydrolase
MTIKSLPITDLGSAAASVVEKLEEKRSSGLEITRMLRDPAQVVMVADYAADVIEAQHAALKHLVRWHDQLSKQDIAKAEAAIAKAEGRA